MLEVRLYRVSSLKWVLETLQILLTDVHINCSAVGLTIEQPGHDRHTFVCLRLPSECFERYRCDRNFAMGMNIKNALKMLWYAGTDDILTLKADDGSDSVTFTFERPDQDETADFKMKVMEVDFKRDGIIDIEFNAVVTMRSLDFAKICGDLFRIGDTVRISVSEDCVQFFTSGDIGRIRITKVSRPEDATKIEVKKPVSLAFDLGHFKSFAEETTLAGQVTISLSPGLPIQIEFQAAALGFIRLYFPPMVEMVA